MGSERRIALTSFYLPSESKIGAGWASHRLANALVELGHDVTMFSPCPRPDDAQYQHVQVPLEGSLRTFRWAWAVRKLDVGQFDAILYQGDDHLVRRGARPLHVRTLHGSCFDEVRYVPGAKEKLRMAMLGLTELVAAIRSPVVVGVSRASLRYFPWRHTVIPNGVDTTRFRPGDEAHREPVPTILFVGTYLRRKRGALLVDVFQREVRSSLPDARLWMVCDDAPDAPGVEVLGRLTDDELAERYRRAWVFCLPSAYEGFGVPYIEALASGLPVVATSNPGAREVLGDGRWGAIATEESLGSELIRLLRDASARQEFSDEGLKRAEDFDALRVARRYVDLIDRLLSSPARSG